MPNILISKVFWLCLCIGEGFINGPFSYVKCHHDSDITKGQCCKDMDSEEE